MTIFQAYCFDSNRDGDFVLTFPDSFVADEWWRAISETPAVAPFFTRVNPQLYTHKASSFNLSAFFTDPRTQDIASQFENRFFVFDDKNGRGLPVVQSINVTNVLSENWYFIRTVASPHLYWDYDADRSDKYLTLSETPRTRFRIRGTNLSRGTVLTDWDPVTVQTYPTSLYVNIVRTDSGVEYQAVAQGGFEHYIYNRLKEGFTVRGAGKLLGYTTASNNPSANTWELVD